MDRPTTGSRRLGRGFPGTAFLLVAALPATAEEDRGPAPPPGVELRLAGREWGPEPFPWMGVAVVEDPASGDRFHLGGHQGGAERGWIGNWRLAADGRTWRELRGDSPVLDGLRDMALAARDPAADAEAAARNLFFAGLTPADRAAEAPGTPLRLAARAAALAADIEGALGSAKASGWEAESIARARARIARAREGLRAAAAGLEAGRLDAPLIARIFDARWALDEAAECLASAPGPRFGSFAGLDPARRHIVVFGGSHGDYTMNDTWVLDPARGTWRRIWGEVAPSPRMAPAAEGPAARPRPMLPDDAQQALVLEGGSTILDRVTPQQGYRPLPPDRWALDLGAGRWIGDGGESSSPPGERTYRTIVPAHDPRWYDAAGPGDPATAAATLAALPANTWVELPAPERSATWRDWGTAAWDPERDAIYRWTGGHEADPGNQVSAYHPAVHRWTIPHVPEIYGKGMSFNGRPDCLNHTYLHYAFDPASRRLVSTSMGGTGIYDPDRGEWEASIPQPFCHHIYETCAVGTPRGVVVWTPGFFGILDVARRRWTALPVAGDLPRSVTDGSAIAYDSRRGCLWMAAFLGYQEPSGEIWRYDLEGGEVRRMGPAGKETIGVAPGFAGEIRESVYLPGPDLVLFNNFVGRRAVAYDPARNRWALLGITVAAEDAGANIGGVSLGMVRDSRRDLVWGLGSYGRIFVLRIEPRTLEVTGGPP